MNTTVPVVPWVVAEMAAILGDEGDTFSKLVAQFKRTLAIRMADLSFAASFGDMPAAARSAQSLEGVSLQFGAERLAGLCAQVKAKALVGALVAEAGLLAELEREAERVRADMEGWTGDGQLRAL